MTYLQRATTDLVQVRRKLISGGELSLTLAPRRAPQFRYQGKKITPATAVRLGW
jgi:hypothetical protein